MKNTPQVRNHPVVKRSSSQAKIKADLALPKGDCHPTCLCLYDRQTSLAFKRIPIPEEEFSKLIELALKEYGQGGRTSDFIAAAIRQKLIPHSPDALDALDFLAKTRDSLITLLQLIADKFEHLAKIDPNSFHGPTAEKFCNGMVILIRSAQEQLEDGYAGVHQNLNPHGFASVATASK